VFWLKAFESGSNDGREVEGGVDEAGLWSETVAGEFVGGRCRDSEGEVLGGVLVMPFFDELKGDIGFTDADGVEVEAVSFFEF